MSLLSRLSSATAMLLVVGTTAYVADLPSKKAAPQTIPTLSEKCRIGRMSMAGSIRV